MAAAAAGAAGAIAEALPGIAELLAIIGGNILASIGIGLIGEWLSKRYMESSATSMIQTYMKMMIPLMIIQLVMGVLFAPLQMMYQTMMYMRW